MRDVYMVVEVRLIVFFNYTKNSVKYKIWRQKQGAKDNFNKINSVESDFLFKFGKRIQIYVID